MFIKKNFKNTKIFLECYIKFSIRLRVFFLNIRTLKTEQTNDYKMLRLGGTL